MAMAAAAAFSAAFSFLSFFSLMGGGMTGEGVGRGKAALFASGGTDSEIGFMGRDVPMGTAVPRGLAVLLAVFAFTPLPHAAEVGSVEATSSKQTGLAF
jgi:hypothetical protein